MIANATWIDGSRKRKPDMMSAAKTDFKNASRCGSAFDVRYTTMNVTIAIKISEKTVIHAAPYIP